GDFAQASDPGNAALVAEVLRAIAPARGLRVLELFGGGGNFTRSLLAAGAQVTVNDLRRPREVPAGARFEGGPAERVVERLGGGPAGDALRDQLADRKENLRDQLESMKDQLDAEIGALQASLASDDGSPAIAMVDDDDEEEAREAEQEAAEEAREAEQEAQEE